MNRMKNDGKPIPAMVMKSWIQSTAASRKSPARQVRTCHCQSSRRDAGSAGNEGGRVLKKKVCVGDLLYYRDDLTVAECQDLK